VTRDDEPRRDLRDLFAAAALTGLLCRHHGGVGDNEMRPTFDTHDEDAQALLATRSYELADAMLALMALCELESYEHLNLVVAARAALRPLVEYVGALEHRVREFEAGAVQRELLRGLPCKCSPDDVQAARELLDWVRGKCPSAHAVHVLRDAVGALDQLRDAVVDARRVEGRLESERISTGLAVVEAIEERNKARSERDAWREKFAELEYEIRANGHSGEGVMDTVRRMARAAREAAPVALADGEGCGRRLHEEAARVEALDRWNNRDIKGGKS
jgi:hypothetical protein